MGKFILGCYIKFDYGLKAELGVTTKLLHPMQESIKQQNTFTTIVAANVEVIATVATMGVMNGSTIQTL